MNRFAPMLAPSGQSRVDVRRQMLAGLLRGGGDTSPITHPMQGIARLAQGLIAGKIYKDIRAEEQAAETNMAQALMAADTGVKEWRNPDNPGEILVKGQEPGLGAAAAVLGQNPTNRGMAANLQMARLMQPERPQEQFETVYDENGNPVAQKSTLTGKVSAHPQAPKAVVPPKPVYQEHGGSMYHMNAEGGPKLVIEGQPETESPAFTPKDIRAGEDKLRAEFNKASGDFVEVRAAYENIESAATNPSAAGDLSLLIGYMKLLDPGSVVREGELATAAAAAGLSDRVVAMFRKVESGQRLSDSQRSDFVGASKRLFSNYQERNRALVSEYVRLANQRKLDPKNVIVNYTGNPDLINSLEEYGYGVAP